MRSFLAGFFRDNAPESMTRATLFFAASVVNILCLSCMFLYFWTDGRLDYSAQVALLSGILLGSSGTMKMIQKNKETSDKP